MAQANNFEQQLEIGREFEDRFAKWLITNGYHVIPKYLYVGKGAPMLYGKSSRLCVPDIDASKDRGRVWYECKHKQVMFRHPATGFSLRLWEHYQKVQDITGCPVWIIFEDVWQFRKWYGNTIDELKKHVYRQMTIGGKAHVLFRYPNAFLVIAPPGVNLPRWYPHDEHTHPAKHIEQPQPTKQMRLML